MSVVSDIFHLPVQDYPTEPTQTWSTLAVALDSAQSDTIFAGTGTPVAFRDDGRWIVDDDALHCAAGQRWFSHLSPADAARIRLLRAENSTSTVSLADICDAAVGFESTTSLDADRMSRGRIWPGGIAGWVGEVGSDKNIRPLGDMFESMTDAVDAVIADIRQRRDELVNILMTGGPLTVRLATTRERWEQPSIEVYITERQQKSWLLHVPVRNGCAGQWGWRSRLPPRCDHRALVGSGQSPDTGTVPDVGEREHSVVPLRFECATMSVTIVARRLNWTCVRPGDARWSVSRGAGSLVTNPGGSPR